VPSNLFRLFLVHRISIYEYIYIYIYENREKKWKKEKEKEFSTSWAGGDFRPSRPTEEWSGAGGRRGCRPTRQREEGVTAWSERRGGANRSSSTAGEVRGGSPPGAWFCDGGVVVRHGQG
jgi:hypothetical protein